MNFSKKVAITLLILAALTVVMGWFLIFSQSDQTEVDTAGQAFDVTDSAFGLNETYEGAQPTGHLYFTGEPKVVDADNPKVNYSDIFALDLETKTINTVTNSGARFSYHRGEDDAHMVVLAADENLDPLQDDIRPIWYNNEKDIYGVYDTATGWNERDLVTSPDGAHIAFSHQETPADTLEDFLDIKKWSIIIHDIKTAEHIHIHEAIRPQWVNGGADLIFIKLDGVYVYNLQTQIAQNIYPIHPNLPTSADIAVHPSDSTFVFTIPEIGMISVGEFTTVGELSFVEYGRLFLPATIVYSPVIDTSGDFYAVMTASKQNDVPNKLQIRPLESKDVLLEFSFDAFKPTSLNLNDWHNTLFVSTITNTQ